MRGCTSPFLHAVAITFVNRSVRWRLRGVGQDLRPSSTHQPRQPFPRRPHPLHQLCGDAFVLATVHLLPQCRALQRSSTEVEGERDQRVELPVRQWHRDQLQHGSFGDPHVLAQKLGGLGLSNARCKLILFMCQHHMPVADGRIAGRADVNGGTEAFKAFDKGGGLSVGGNNRRGFIRSRVGDRWIWYFWGDAGSRLGMPLVCRPGAYGRLAYVLRQTSIAPVLCRVMSGS